jgi:hypothetical protein
MVILCFWEIRREIGEKIRQLSLAINGMIFSLFREKLP